MEGQNSDPAQLPFVIDRLAKIDSSILTFLCVQGLAQPIDYMTLSKLDALASLMLEYRRDSDFDVEGMGERRLRNWGRAVFEKGSFKRLKVFVLSDCGLRRDAIIQGVSAFPALILIGTNGWTTSKGDAREMCGDWHTVSDTW